MEFLNKKQKTFLTIIGFIVLVFIGCYIFNKTENINKIELDTEDMIYEIEEETIIDDKIKVHITGEVQNEGIIETEKNARIADVIEEAGGTTEEADLSKINLAYAVKDGQKIYIPNIEENVEEPYITDEAGDGILPEEDFNSKHEKVNINTAKQTELETLSGIGPSTALKIINYRNENGDFKSIEDLKNVPGIGDSKFEAIKEDICI